MQGSQFNVSKQLAVILVLPIDKCVGIEIDFSAFTI